MRGAWWADGVHFSCQPDCGRCCDEPGGIVYLSRTDAQRLADHAGLSVQEYLRRDCTTTLDGRYVLRSNQSDGICIYLDEKKQCTIYEVRPQQCKAFPWWAENLRSKRSWNNVKATCPGLTAEDAILIRGEEIRLHVHADRQSTQGFRVWDDA